MRRELSELAPQTQRLLATQKADDLAAGEGRAISYIFSDETVARDGHTIRNAGWDLENFLQNPVFLWCHDSSEPPIGRVTSIVKTGSRLIGTVEYADADTYDFADTIFRLTKAGYINATSVSWAPLEWKWSQDKARPGGIDFLRQELLEISAVPVPALPTALATARAAGIDTGPLYRWAEKVLDGGNLIIIPRAELEQLRRDAKPEIPSKPKAKTEDLAMPKTREAKTVKPKTGKRDLYDVSYLASLLNSLGYLQDSVEFEAEIEGDGSEIPQKLADSLKALGAVLVEMTAEEVAEMLERGKDVKGPDERVAALGLMRQLDEGALGTLISAAKSHLAGEKVIITRGALSVALGRAGKSLSRKNTDALEAIHKTAGDLAGQLRSFIDDNSDDEDEEGDDTEDSDIATRTRTAEAARAKHRFENAE